MAGLQGHGRKVKEQKSNYGVQYLNAHLFLYYLQIAKSLT